jgi:hypothetical protein
MRYLFIAIAAPAALVFCAGVFADGVKAADVAPPPTYGLPPANYEVPFVEYGPPRFYGVPPHAPFYGPLRLACWLQWQCSPWDCGLRPACTREPYVSPYSGSPGRPINRHWNGQK